MPPGPRKGGVAKKGRGEKRQRDFHPSYPCTSGRKGGKRTERGEEPRIINSFSERGNAREKKNRDFVFPFFRGGGGKGGDHRRGRREILERFSSRSLLLHERRGNALRREENDGSISSAVRRPARLRRKGGSKKKESALTQLGSRLPSCIAKPGVTKKEEKENGKGNASVQPHHPSCQ